MPQRGLRAVNVLFTGMHEPEATHLAMLEALAGVSHIKVAYEEALRKGYLWHEFGDLHLILPNSAKSVDEAWLPRVFSVDDEIASSGKALLAMTL